MNLKKRVAVISNKLNPPVDENELARQQELRRRLDEAKKRCGMVETEPLVYDYKPGINNLADNLKKAREASLKKHLAGLITK
ncbi:MAG: hypothetical protein A4E71_02555 [Smithella sp. PtaU1.Bin162]|nr:MAG: hypothetical protein A4E71_02555 [Smithella sp. PtaU1.Bin162]